MYLREISIMVYPNLYRTKRCPYCRVNLASHEEKCFSCGHRVGALDPKTGYARVPSRWKNTIVCILAWVAFGVYMWWAFFKKW